MSNLTRLIVGCYHPDYASFCEYSKPYPYRYNFAYSCIEVNDESLCFIKLKYKLSKHWAAYTDIPTYAVGGDE